MNVQGILLRPAQFKRVTFYTFIAQLGGRHEDLFNPENSCRPTYWAINCLLYRKLKKHLSSSKHALNRSFAYVCLSFYASETWRA